VITNNLFPILCDEFSALSRVSFPSLLEFNASVGRAHLMGTKFFSHGIRKILLHTLDGILRRSHLRGVNGGMHFTPRRLLCR
jgi:hypothetical protein